MDKNLSCRLPMIVSQQKIAKLLCFSNLAISFVNPWGVFRVKSRDSGNVSNNCDLH